MSTVVVDGGVVGGGGDNDVKFGHPELAPKGRSITLNNAGSRRRVLFLPKLTHPNNFTPDAAFEELKWVNATTLGIQLDHMGGYFEAGYRDRIGVGRISDYACKTSKKKISHAWRKTRFQYCVPQLGKIQYHIIPEPVFKVWNFRNIQAFTPLADRRGGYVLVG
jgi:hypothetical protein